MPARESRQMSGPIGVVADYALAVLALTFGLRLILLGKRRVEASMMVFAGGLVALSVSTLAGAAAHGVARLAGGAGLQALWRVSALAIGLASFSLVAGAVLACSKGPWRRLLLGLAAFKLVLFSFWLLSQTRYDHVDRELLSALVIVVILETCAWVKRRAKSVPLVVAGSAVAITGVLIQPGALVVHSGLDHSPIYFLLMLAGLWLLFLGGCRLHDRFGEDRLG
jgi:hypothetical protein